MNEPFGDDPYWHENTEKMGITACRRQRVLTLAREMMLAQMANPDIDEFHFGTMVSLAESWIASEDAYTLPEDMR